MACGPPKSGLVRRRHARPILSRAETGIREIYAELRHYVRSEDAHQQRTRAAFHQIPENSGRVQGGTGGGSLDSKQECHVIHISAAAQAPSACVKAARVVMGEQSERKKCDDRPAYPLK